MATCRTSQQFRVQYKRQFCRGCCSHRASLQLHRTKLSCKSHRWLWQRTQPRTQRVAASKRGQAVCYASTAAGSPSGGRDGRKQAVKVKLRLTVDLQTSATSASNCFKFSNLLQDLDRQRFLLRYVQNVQPEVMEDFVRHAPAHVSRELTSGTFRTSFGDSLAHVRMIMEEPAAAAVTSANSVVLQVVDAMRQTITNILGTLVPEFFEISISAKGEDLAQLMYTILMSGYMFRNAQYRLELRDSMLPSGMLHGRGHQDKF